MRQIASSSLGEEQLATRIVVRLNEAKDMDFIATRAGSYELTCADHDWAGMTARITVE